MLEAPTELRTGDLDRFRDAVGGLLCPFTLAPRAREYDARLRHHALGGLAFTTIAYGNPIEIDVPDRQPLFLLQLATAGTFEARTTGPKYVVSRHAAQLVRPATPILMRCPADCTMLVVTLAGAEILDEARALAGGEPELTELWPLTGEAASLGRCVGYLHAEAQSADSLFHGPRGTRQARQMLLALLLDGAQASARPAAAAGAWYVKRAEDFMIAHLADDIGVADVVESAGVSLRSLYCGFRTTHGVAPMTWLKQ